MLFYINTIQYNEPKAATSSILMWQLLGSWNSSQTRLRLLSRSCCNAGVANSWRLIGEPQPPLLQLHSRVTAPKLGPNLPSPITHASLSQPPPFHRYHLQSVKLPGPRRSETTIRPKNNKTHDLTEWWPPPVQHLIWRSPQFQ